ncbi:methyltransferase domain-containing protein [Actinophytocola glycyrrhizae]|uniref:Methyltransferase domain-containing protein n=1 Tax=Actinophytocola glycyrrhizae TaxID=2044873 RepID=A0ABV9SBN2_9PSEU
MTGSVGQFTTVDDTADASWFIRFMDVANAVPEYGEIRESLVGALGPLAGRDVLDVGCGTGDDARELAALGARVVATDISDAMLAEARRRGGAVRFVREDVHALSFPSASFDGVRVKLVRQHSPAIDTADDELVRVLRPGGRLAVFDYDFETLALDHPDRETTRAIVRYWVDNHREGWSGRQLRRRFASRGMTGLSITPHTVQMPFGFFRSSMEGTLTQAVRAGAVPADPARWWRPLVEAEADGHFFASLTGYVLGATR